MSTVSEMPLPGAQALGGTVIASVHYREADDELPNDRYTLMVLMPEPPYYKVAVVEDQDGTLVEEWTVIHQNIVPAVNGGTFVLSDRTLETRDGYQDMGGDF